MRDSDSNGTPITTERDGCPITANLDAAPVKLKAPPWVGGFELLLPIFHTQTNPGRWVQGVCIRTEVNVANGQSKIVQDRQLSRLGDNPVSVGAKGVGSVVKAFLTL